MQLSVERSPPSKLRSFFNVALNTTTNALIGTQKIAFAAEEIIEDLAKEVQVIGEIAGFTGLVEGLPVYASVTTPGSYQTTAPVASGQWIIQLMGYAGRQQPD